MAELSRRGLIGGSAALAGSGAVGGCGRMFCPPDALGLAVLDVHCHIHNAADLSVEGFLEQAVLHDEDAHARQGEPVPARRRRLVQLAGVLARGVRGLAPTAEAELGLYRADVLSAPGGGGIEPGREEVIDGLAREVQALAADAGTEPASGLGPGGEPGPEQALYQSMLEEAGIAEFATAAGGEAAPADGRAFHRGLVERLLAGFGAIGRAFRWVVRLTRTRTRIAEEYARAYPDVRFMCPQLLDYVYWLNDPCKVDCERGRFSEGDLRLADQIAVMHAIQRSFNADPARPSMHGFMAFDPLRDAVSGGAGLDLVRCAVEEAGFVGVKLYPTMGFRPHGNLVGDEHLDRIRRNFGAHLGQPLNRSLETLYAWCAAEGVPILAHANPSYGPAQAYLDRAAPVGWEPVLRAHPKLRVNLAHFGDFSDDRTPGHPDGPWEHQSIALIREFPGQAFVDLSFHATVLESGANYDRVVDSFRALRDADPEMRSVLFGTDWFQLAIVGRSGEYMPRFSAFLDDIGLDAAMRGRVFARNGADFLGLRDPAGNGGRLRRYYEGLGADYDALLGTLGV